jgi:hypothetical protein
LAAAIRTPRCGPWICDATIGVEDIKIFDRKWFPDGYSKLGSFHPDYRRFDGTWGVEIFRELLGRSNSVSVLPYEPIRNEVVLLNSFSSLPALPTSRHVIPNLSWASPPFSCRKRTVQNFGIKMENMQW